MMDKEKIQQHINSIVALSDEEWEVLFNFIEIVTLKKNSYFLKEGNTCNSIAYVNNGSLIYFKSMENGVEITTDFAFEGDWVTDNHSRLNQLPSYLNIRTMQDATLLIIKHETLPQLFNRIPKLEKLGRILMEQAFIKIAQLSTGLQVLSATERYRELVEKHPEILEKIPLYHIANYLGIAPKSLSRIRKEISNRF